MDLKWQPPLKDGGAPIEKYIVEKKEKDSPVWTKAAVVDGKSCEARVPDLIPGETYEFRVRAVNAAGPGEPSETTKPMIAKPRKCESLLSHLLHCKFSAIQLWKNSSAEIHM